VLLVNRQPERFGKIVLTGPAGLRQRKSFFRWLRVHLHKAGIIKSRGSADYRALSAVGKATFKNIVNRDLSAEIARIRQPVLVIWGDQDTAIKKYMIKRWTKLQIRATLKVYKGCGHFCFLDKPARFVLDTEEFINVS
jgi:pimeloyl-ACP methyl ester carboxylesterase